MQPHRLLAALGDKVTQGLGTVAAQAGDDRHLARPQRALAIATGQGTPLSCSSASAGSHSMRRLPRGRPSPRLLTCATSSRRRPANSVAVQVLPGVLGHGGLIRHLGIEQHGAQHHGRACPVAPKAAGGGLAVAPAGGVPGPAWVSSRYSTSWLAASSRRQVARSPQSEAAAAGALSRGDKYNCVPAALLRGCTYLFLGQRDRRRAQTNPKQRMRRLRQQHHSGLAAHARRDAGQPAPESAPAAAPRPGQRHLMRARRKQDGQRQRQLASG